MFWVALLNPQDVLIPRSQWIIALVFLDLFFEGSETILLTDILKIYKYKCETHFFSVSNNSLWSANAIPSFSTFRPPRNG